MYEFTKDTCQIILKKYLKNSDFRYVSSEVKILPGAETGFFGIPKKLYMTIMENKKENSTTLTFFVKEILYISDFHIQLIKEMRVYYKECEVYKHLLDKLSEYIQGRIYPEYYFSEENQVIVLEDLSILGFRTKPVSQFYTIEELQMALEALAKFHGASIIYEEKNQTRINEEHWNIMYESLFAKDKNHMGNKFLQCSINLAKCLLETHFDHVPLEIRRKALQMMREIPDNVWKPGKNRSTLVHGDMWSNNIMFSYNNQEEVEEIRFVDFQMTRYGEPIYDVLFLIHNVSTHSFRKENMESLLIHYYNALEKTLKRANIDLKPILSWEEFNVSVRETLPIALAVISCYTPIISLPEEKLKSVMENTDLYKKMFIIDKRDVVMSAMCSDESYRKRVIESLVDLIESVKKQ